MMARTLAVIGMTLILCYPALGQKLQLSDKFDSKCGEVREGTDLVVSCFVRAFVLDRTTSKIYDCTGNVGFRVRARPCGRI